MHSSGGEEAVGRSDFEDRLAERLARADGGQFALCALRFERLRLVDDYLNWETSLVGEIRRRLVTGGEEVAVFGQLGPEIFGVLIEEVEGRREAGDIGGRLHRRVVEPIRHGDRRFIPQVTCCIVLGGDHAEGVDELLRDVGLGLVFAGRQPGRQLQVVGSDEHRSLRRDIELETDMLRDLEQGRFELRYQPIVDLQTGRARGFESLMRWNHAERGWLSAGAFIPIAEQNGWIGRLDEWGFGQACRQIAEWEQRGEAGEMFVTVNFSRSDLVDRQSVHRAVEQMSEAGIDPSRVRLEVTETELLDSLEIVGENLEYLSEAGVGIWIDDFGVGAASMQSLQLLPVDGIKIDRTFVAHPDPTVFRALVELGNSLGVEIVAEGIETQRELERARSTGCRLGQGFLFERSQPAGRVLSTMNDRYIDQAAK
jgi:EAL domain-containing protein (putative c-di-GMP-specific phosphodiesterase class I)